MKRAHLHGWALFAVSLALYFATTHQRVFSAGNDAARWATIESIVERGTTAIDGSRFAATVDRVQFDDHLYSNKPPALAFAGAAVYGGARQLFGWQLSGAGAPKVLRLTTVLLVGLPAALLVLLFHRALGRFAGISVIERAWWTMALAAGTLIWPFATTLNAHLPAALLLFAAFLAALDGRSASAGLAVGAAALFDLLPGAGMAPFLAAIVWQTAPRDGLRRFLLALSAPAAVGLLLNLLHHGSLLPLKLVRGAVDLAAAAGPSAGGVVLPQGATYPLEILFGGHGLFFVSPILVAGLAGLFVACRRAPFGPAAAWRWLAAGLLLQFAGHAALAGSFGGWSYGYRYLLPIQPMLLLAAPLAVAIASERAWRGSRLVASAVAATLFTVSVLFSALGAFHPWPPAFEQKDPQPAPGAAAPPAGDLRAIAAMVRNPVGGNAAAWLTEQAPDSSLTDWATARWVSADAGDARRYYYLFFGSKGDYRTMRRFAE